MPSVCAVGAEVLPARLLRAMRLLGAVNVAMSQITPPARVAPDDARLSTMVLNSSRFEPTTASPRLRPPNVPTS